MSGNLDPYKSAPNKAFWSRSVARNWRPAEVVDCRSPLIGPGEAVASAGSCFASNIVPYIERAGFRYIRTETQHPAFSWMEKEAFGYANFSAAYGNIYTARQLVQLLERCHGEFRPVEDRWQTSDGVIDPFRPGLRYRAGSDREFDLLTAQHLRFALAAFQQADVFVFTLGLTEAWISVIDGAVFPACPGTIAGSFDPERHVFKNFSVAEIVSDLARFIGLLRQINPAVRVILTVSPVPLVATASGRHVLAATTYSKSVLRVAAEEIAGADSAVSYFPAYEIVTGPQAPQDFFEPDRRNVSRAAIDVVMAAFLACCNAAEHVVPATVPEYAADTASDLSRAIVEFECEEAMADRTGPILPRTPRDRPLRLG